MLRSRWATDPFTLGAYSFTSTTTEMDHFDQIASWTEKEIAWVDDNLEGFKGRVTREDWVQQARDLMNGLPPRPGGEK